MEVTVLFRRGGRPAPSTLEACNEEQQASEPQPRQSEALTSRATHAKQVARKVAVGTAGVTVLAIGVALIVLPGPAIIVIPLGLAILATEFLWARRLLERVQKGTAGWLKKRRSAHGSG